MFTMSGSWAVSGLRSAPAPNSISRPARGSHAISYRRLSRLLLELFGLAISEGALDAAFQRAMPCFDAEVGAILARPRRARVVCSDETSVRVDGRTCWNWVFQNADVVILVVRHSRGAGVVREVMDGHRPAIWVSDLSTALSTGMPRTGRFAWRTSCATASSPSRRATASSRRA